MLVIILTLVIPMIYGSIDHDMLKDSVIDSDELMINAERLKMRHDLAEYIGMCREKSGCKIISVTTISPADDQKQHILRSERTFNRFQNEKCLFR